MTGTVVDQNNIVAISIIRAADSMLDSFMHVVPEASIGKVSSCVSYVFLV